jgi:hypothetical protein
VGGCPFSKRKPEDEVGSADTEQEDSVAHADELLANVKAQLTKALAAVEYTKQEAE